MSRRRTPAKPYPADWLVFTEYTPPGRSKLLPGGEFTVRGIRGRLRFHHAIGTEAGEEWVTGRDKNNSYRSFHPDRILTVHRIHKTRQGQQ